MAPAPTPSLTTVRTTTFVIIALQHNDHVVADPVVLSITPNSTTSGSTVTITGTGFGPLQGLVSINGIQLASVGNWQDTFIVGTVPIGVGVNLSVVVNTTAAQFNVANTLFSYQGTVLLVSPLAACHF